jgi:hypothetical protein
MGKSFAEAAGGFLPVPDLSPGNIHGTPTYSNGDSGCLAKDVSFGTCSQEALSVKIWFDSSPEGGRLPFLPTPGI